ncbi:uncharacterized protein LOC130727346 [Lotus japonicus]|uniref:uncharacterized protein LOC130727346 n=1 Tax=Lotus japonicus TaxID=34305 RepID=UPI0025834EC1|nr:uncharacterized protein LOC130727346 [Lotus japonicus]
MNLPVVGRVWFRGHWYKVEYEGLHLLCSKCGCYGHMIRQCTKAPTPLQVAISTENPAAPMGSEAAATEDMQQSEATVGRAGVAQSQSEVSNNALTPLHVAVNSEAITASPVKETIANHGEIKRGSIMGDSVEDTPDMHGTWLTVTRRKASPKSQPSKTQGPRKVPDRTNSKIRGISKDPILGGALAARKIKERDNRLAHKYSSQGKSTADNYMNEPQGKKRLRASPQVNLNEKEPPRAPNITVRSSSNLANTSSAMEPVKQKEALEQERPIMMNVDHIAGNHYRFVDTDVEQDMECTEPLKELAEDVTAPT